MLRKITLALIATASLGAAALVPGTASAGGFHHGGWHGGWHSGWHGGFGHTYYSGLYWRLSDGCIQQRVVEPSRAAVAHRQRLRFLIDIICSKPNPGRVGDRGFCRDHYSSMNVTASATLAREVR